MKAVKVIITFLLFILFFHTPTTTMQQEPSECDNSIRFYKSKFQLSNEIEFIIDTLYDKFTSAIATANIQQPSFDKLLLLLNETLAQHSFDHNSLFKSDSINDEESYTFDQALSLVLSCLLFTWHLDISLEQCIKDFKHLITFLVMEQFNQYQFKWCPCEKLYVTDRIMGILKTVDLINKKHHVEQCSNVNPLVYTSFGSGNFLHDYLTLLMLRRNGYNHFVVNFIDIIYHPHTHLSLQAILKRRLQSVDIDDVSLNFFNSHITYLNNFKKRPFKNSILTAVDAHEYNQVPRDIIEERATYAEIYVGTPQKKEFSIALLNLRKRLLKLLPSQSCSLIQAHYQRVKPKLIECLRTTDSRLQLIKEIPIILNQINNHSPDRYCILWHKCQKEDFKELKEYACHSDTLITTQNNHTLKAFCKNGIPVPTHLKNRVYSTV